MERSHLPVLVGRNLSGRGSLAKGERRGLVESYHPKKVLPAGFSAFPEAGSYFAIFLAAAIAALTPDFSRIALIFARCSFERFRRAAMYLPCCW